MCTVIAVSVTGWGTLGPKWSALVLTTDGLNTWKDAWKFEDIVTLIGAT